MMVTRYGNAKNYVLPAFEQMMSAYVVGTPGVDIIWAGDRPDDEIHLPSKMTNCADIVRKSREAARLWAIENEYDRVLWQGIDSLYRSREDFERLISHDLPIVSTLICGRTNTSQACARRFHRVKGQWVPQQYDIPDAELVNGHLVQAGWPGVDNVVIRRDLFDIPIEGPEWYELDNQPLDRPQRSRDGNAEAGNNDHSERFCLEAVRRGYSAWIDTRVRVWHVHEKGAPGGGPLARLYPDIEVPLCDLTWT